MNRDDPSEGIQPKRPGNAGHREGGATTPVDPRFLRQQHRRTPSDRIGLLIGAACGAMAGVALASCWWSPIHLAYNEGPGSMGGVDLDGMPAAMLCGIIGASLLANAGWTIGLLIGLLRKARHNEL